MSHRCLDAARLAAVIAIATTVALAAPAAAGTGPAVTTVAVIGEFSAPGDVAVIGEFSLPGGLYQGATRGKARLSLDVAIRYTSGGAPVELTAAVPLTRATLVADGPVATIRAPLGTIDAALRPDAGIIGPEQVIASIIGPEKPGIIGPERSLGAPVTVAGVIGEFSVPTQPTLYADLSLSSGVYRAATAGGAAFAFAITVDYTSGGLPVEKRALVALAQTQLQLPITHVDNTLGPIATLRAVVGPAIFGADLPDGGIIGPERVHAAVVRTDLATLQPLISFVPSHFLELPPTVAGYVSEPRQVEVHNSGFGVLLVTGITTKGDFATVGSNCFILGPGASCHVDVVFTPGAVGDRSGSLIVTGSTTTQVYSLALLGTGTEAVPDAEVSPQLVEFGNQLVYGASAPLPVLLTNTGTVPLDAELSITGDFTIQDSTCSWGPVAAGGACWIFVQFAPTEEGVRAGELTIFDGTYGRVYRVALSGTGTPRVPGIQLGPDVNETLGLSFPTTNVGEVSEQSFDLLSTGDTLLYVGRITATGDFAVTSSCGDVAPGDRCSVHVTFAPTADGLRTGTLTIEHDAPGSPLVLPLAGTGHVTSPAILIGPDMIEGVPLPFGTVQVGDTSYPRTFSVFNTGDAMLTFWVGVTGDFRVTSPWCEGDLAPGQQCSFELTFVPTATGERTGELTIHSNAGDGVASFPLTGTGS